MELVCGRNCSSMRIDDPSLGVATCTTMNGCILSSGTLNGTVTGTNTGDVTLAINHGLGLSGQVLNMGTPSTVSGTSTNAVTTTTHTHAMSYTSSDGSSGVTGNFTYVKSWDVTGIITVKNGLITNIT